MTVRSNLRQPPSRLAIIEVVTVAPLMPNGENAPWPLNRPAHASVLLADRVRYGQWKFSMHSVSFADEADGVTKVDQLLAGRTATTFEGRSFAWPVLAMAAMRAKVFNASHIAAAWTSCRLMGPAVDLADWVCGSAAANGASLVMLCEQLCIPCQENVCGSDAAAILRADGAHALADFAEERCGAIMMLFASVQALRSGDMSYGATLICDFANWCLDAEQEHLAPLGQLSGQELLERARVNHMLDAGLWSLDHRLRLKRAGATDTGSIFNPGFEDYDG